jgi:hypothetical protein
MARERPSELDYLRRIERLAHEVAEQAAVQGWLTFGSDGEHAAIPLHRAINELATNLRVVHPLGDGCSDHCADQVVDPA